uniref:Uncharacterized protein n=1 Tax=Glossina palpalis gambiensis TaxID=67801 RepID=A0A1B0B0S3_9MUSC
MNGVLTAGAVAPVVPSAISLEFVPRLGSAEKGAGVGGGGDLWSTFVLNCPLSDVVSLSIVSVSWSSNEICVVGVVVINDDLDAAIAASRVILTTALKYEISKNMSMRIIIIYAYRELDYEPNFNRIRPVFDATMEFLLYKEHRNGSRFVKNNISLNNPNLI